MKRVLAGVVMAMTLVPALASAQSMVILTRHAERADGQATMTTASGAPADPKLSAAGEARAAKLAAMLAESGITAMFTTEFARLTGC